MLIFLIFLLALSCLLAMLLGFFLDRLMASPTESPATTTVPQIPLGGPLIMGLATLIAGAVTLFVAHALYRAGYLPLYHLSPPYIALGSEYIATAVVIIEAALLAYPLVAALGYFLNRGIGVIVMTIFSTFAGIICVFFSCLPGMYYALPRISNLGALAGVVLVGSLGLWFFTKGLRCQARGLPTLVLLWFGYAAIWWFGYQIAGQIGLLLISIPIVFLFWIALYHLSGYILPAEKEQQLEVFRSLLTFNLGTNYPYYIIDDWKNQSNQDQRVPAPRVSGNPFGMFLAGPGIILTTSDQLSVVTDGFTFEIPAPGLSFTKIFQQIYAAVDLRPQLRCTTIKSETKDGIETSIFTFMPHRIATGGKKETLGESYPYDKDAVLKAVFDYAVVDHEWRREEGQAIENLKRTPWEEVILTVAPPLMKEVIAGYECNQLHAPGNPRVDIANKFKNKLNAAIVPLGIELVGGGISNIIVEDKIFDQRIRNWEVQWEREKEFARGEAEAEAAKQIEEVWRSMELEMLYKLTRIFDTADQISQEVLAYKLIEAIGAQVDKTSEEEAEGENHLGKTNVDYYLKRLTRRRSI